MDKLAAMQTFVDIVDRGSLTAAAEAQERSVPTVVRTLGALERQLGVRLLNRTTRHMSLTAEGRDYLEHCRRILAEIQEAELSVVQRQKDPEGEIRITNPDLFGQLHVVPSLTDFLAFYPKVQLEVLLLDRVVNLVEDGIDLAVRIGEIADSSLTAVPVGRMRRIVCASPEFLERHGVPQHPQDLTKAPCVLFRGNSSGRQWNFTDQDRQLGITVGGAFTCNRAMAAAQGCVDGLGFGHLLHYQAVPFLREGRLVIVLEEFEPVPVPVSLVYQETPLVSSRLRILVTWLEDTLRRPISSIAETD